MNENMIVKSGVPCRAKDPATCKYHGAEQRMNAAALANDLGVYFTARTEWESLGNQPDGELQTFLKETIDEPKRYRVNTKEMESMFRYRNPDFPEIFDVRNENGTWDNDYFNFVDDIHDPQHADRFIMVVRRQKDGKLFGAPHYSRDAEDPNFHYDFEAGGAHLIELHETHRVDVRTTYVPVNLPTIDQIVKPN